MIARWWILGVLAVMVLPRAEAHQELYHNVDVDLEETAETGVIKISITVHAPELLVSSSEAADAMFDARWLGNQTDEELELIVGLARHKLAQQFELRFDERDLVDLKAELAFDDYGTMRSVAGRELPPACILATLELAQPPGTRRLHLEAAASLEKRLILTVYRPGEFPGVIEVEPGSRAVVGLPTAAGESAEFVEEGSSRGALDATTVVASLGFFGSVFLLAWWMRRRASARSTG